MFSSTILNYPFLNNNYNLHEFMKTGKLKYKKNTPKCRCESPQRNSINIEKRYRQKKKQIIIQCDETSDFNLLFFFRNIFLLPLDKSRGMLTPFSGALLINNRYDSCKFTWRRSYSYARNKTNLSREVLENLRIICCHLKHFYLVKKKNYVFKISILYKNKITTISSTYKQNHGATRVII